MHGSFLGQALVYLAAAVVAVPLARRLGLGSVLGYLLAGIAIGPFCLGLVGAEGHDVMSFAELGVVMMLFVVGLELQPAVLWRLRAPILGLGGLQVTITALVIAAIAVGLGIGWREAVAIGLTLAMSSTAIVLQSLAEKGLLTTSGGRSAFSVLLFQDIAVIPILAFLPLLAAGAGHADGGHGTWVEGLPAWARVLCTLAAIGAVVGGGRTVVRVGLRAVAHTRLRELFTAATLLLVVGIAVLMIQVGLSPALGAFLAGVVLATSEYRHELEGDIEPFKGLLLGLFFIAVGASIDFALVADSPATVLGLTAGLVAVKCLVLLVLARIFRLALDQGVLLALALAQTGEFAFVLLAYAGRLGVLAPALTGPLTAAVALSMAATPLLLLLEERVLRPRLGTRERADREPDAIEHHAEVVIAGFGEFGATVGRLLRANGFRATVLEIDSDRVDVLRKLGLEVYYGDASRLDLLHAAGMDHATMLVVAVGDRDKTREIVRAARAHFPDVEILARAADRAEAWDLLELGVTRVYRETLDTSLRVGVDALRLLGVRAVRARRAAQTFRRHDEEAVRRLLDVRRDAGFLSAARREVEALESTIEDDLTTADLPRDAGWDVESLRADAVSGGLAASVGARPPEPS
jgi:monovalent cation:proton antiporter-2 (CPA2) family protein